MGLYLCVFDAEGDEIDGVEVGLYSDFNFFRDTVTKIFEHGQAGSSCPILISHSDSDGEWSSSDSLRLIDELDRISSEMKKHPPVELNSEWKKDVARLFGINPTDLLSCFFDVDGEPLVERLRSLAETSVSHDRPILFQ